MSKCDKSIDFSDVQQENIYSIVNALEVFRYSRPSIVVSFVHCRNQS